MKIIFFVTLIFHLAGGWVESSRAEDYFAATYMSSSDAAKKWGSEAFNAKTFKSSSEKSKGAMVVHLLQKKLLVGSDMSSVRRDLGDPDSYFFSDTIYAYMITSDVKPKQESWELVFIPDANLKKVADIKIHKKCCYEVPDEAK